MDLAGELPSTARGNRYVMIEVEYFTKWVELVPLKSKSTADMAHAFLDQMLSRFGALGEVLTDQGKEFSCWRITKKCKGWHLGSIRMLTVWRRG